MKIDEAITQALAEAKNVTDTHEFYSILTKYCDLLDSNEDKYRLEKAMKEEYPDKF